MRSYNHSPEMHIDASGVIDRMKKAVSAETDIVLATHLGVKKTTISSWRQRNSVPYAECVRIAYAERVSLDWLVTGTEKDDLYKGLIESEIDPELLAVFLMDQERHHIGRNFKDPWKGAVFRARSLIIKYIRYKEMLDEEVTKHGVPREAFIEHLKRTIKLLSTCDDDMDSEVES